MSALALWRLALMCGAVAVFGFVAALLVEVGLPPVAAIVLGMAAGVGYAVFEVVAQRPLLRAGPPWSVRGGWVTSGITGLLAAYALISLIRSIHSHI